jgi:hypothetical protein
MQVEPMDETPEPEGTSQESELDHIRRAAASLAQQPLKREDLEKLSAVYQNLSEIEGREREKANQKRVLSMEAWKSFATVTVPLLTLVTLAITVYMQNSQISAAREANEDTQWRQALKSFSVVHNDPLADLTADAGLKSLYTSSRYAGQAYAMTSIMLGHMGDMEGFRDLYSSAYGSAGWPNIATVADIARGLAKNYWDIDALMNDASGQPSDRLPPSFAAQYGRGPAGRASLDHYLSEIGSELVFVSSEICSTLRTPRTNDWAKATLDLSSMYLWQSECSNADFGYVDLSSARLETVNLHGARLLPTAFSDSHWIESPWWTAEAVEGGLLGYLKDQNYPYKAGGEYGDAESKKRGPSKEEYISRVTSLCKAASINCDPATVPFGSPSQAQDKKS